MIYVATEKTPETHVAYFSKNRKALKDKGFRWINTFDNEQKAIIWVNESYLCNEKEYLY